MLKITYHSRSKNEITTRRIHPLALLYRGVITELIFCDDGGELPKRFLLNRIKKAQIQIQSVITPDNFNLDEFINKQLAFPASGDEIQLKAWIHHGSRQIVEETPLSKFQNIEEAEQGIIVTAVVQDSVDLTSWILGLGPRIKVLEPESIREKIVTMINKMAQKYQ